MKTVLGYIYYRFYFLFTFFDGKNNSAHVSSCLFLSFVLLCTMEVVLQLSPQTKGFFFMFDGFMRVIVTTFFVIIIYFFTIHKNKHKGITERYQNEKSFSKILGSIIVLLISFIIIGVNFFNLMGYF